MSTTITIAGTDYSLPSQGQNAPWGDDLSAIIQALASVANESVGSADILTTSFTVANNVSAATNVTGLVFDTSSVRSAIISYSIYRSTSSSELSESGQIYVTYYSVGGTWNISQNYAGSSGVSFSITPSGQVQYTSSNLSGTSYVGKMKFSAKSFLQS